MEPKQIYIEKFPLAFVRRMLLDRNPGLETNTEADPFDCVPISEDLALLLNHYNDDSFVIQQAFTEWNQSPRILFWDKRAYTRSYGKWLDAKKLQDDRAKMSYSRDEAIASITKALHKKYENMDLVKCEHMAKTMVMDKNQVFIDALELGINVSELSDDVTTKCEIVDKNWYQEEAKRKAKANDYSEF